MTDSKHELRRHLARKILEERTNLTFVTMLGWEPEIRYYSGKIRALFELAKTFARKKK